MDALVVDPAGGAGAANPAATTTTGSGAASEPPDSRAEFLAFLNAQGDDPGTTPADAPPRADESATGEDPAGTTGGTEDDATNPTQAGAPQPPSIRQLIKSSNLPAQAKESLIGAAYLAEQMKELGFDVEAAKTLRELNMTPEEALFLRQSVAATRHDAETMKGEAEAFRSFGRDLVQDPVRALQGMQQRFPEGFQNVVDTVAGYLHRISPDHYNALVSTGLEDVLRNAKSRATASGDLTTAASLDMAWEAVFGRPMGEEGAARGRGPKGGESEDPRVSRLEAELRAERNARFEAAQTNVLNAAYMPVMDEIRKRVTSAQGLSLTEQGVNSFCDRVARVVVETFRSDSTRMANYQRLVAAGNGTAAAKYLVDAAKALMTKPIQEEIAAMRSWFQTAESAPGQRTVPPAAPASASAPPPTRGAPPGTTPRAAPTTLPDTVTGSKSFLAFLNGLTPG